MEVLQGEIRALPGVRRLAVGWIRRCLLVCRRCRDRLRQVLCHDCSGGHGYNYSTLYLRKTFAVANPTAWDKLLLELKRDDGVVVWINGRLALMDNVTQAELPFDATAISAIEDTEFAPFDLGSAASFLVAGTNVIAVQVLNASLSGSSDCFIDVRLTAPKPSASTTTPAPTVTPTVSRQPGKYEIEPVWESGVLPTFNANIKVPASAVKPGRTYRLRCRMKDDTGRWSHWSAPVQFVAGEPISAGILADLRLTELMYNPAPGADGTAGDEFEFIELKNIGDETLDLSSVSITSGVTFSFQGSDVTSLGSGAFVLVVRNRPAFLSRYGTTLSGRIAGQYSGKLSNNGEQVTIVDFWNGTLADLSYGDGSGWPLSADGAGHSLVPVDAAPSGRAGRIAARRRQLAGEHLSRRLARSGGPAADRRRGHQRIHGG